VVTLVPQSLKLVAARFGSLGFVLVAALINSLVAAHSATGRTVAGCIFGIPLLLVLSWWFRSWRKPDQLEVSQDTIRYVPGHGRAAETLFRADGGELRFVVAYNFSAKFYALHQSRSGKELPLRHFRRQEVATAGDDRGWTFATRPWWRRG
jgi:hypothetical protein